MITCLFDGVGKAALRHVTVSGIVLDKKRPGKILLARRAPNLKNGGLWCIPGGYLDRDETTTEAVCREVVEETGYEVQVVSLFRLIDVPSRPKEDRQNVEFSYIVDVVRHPGKMNEETTELKWYDLSDIPDEKEWAYDHGETVRWYVRFQNERFRLPIYNNTILY